jgi:hypothetical protein
MDVESVAARFRSNADVALGPDWIPEPGPCDWCGIRPEDTGAFLQQPALRDGCPAAGLASTSAGLLRSNPRFSTPGGVDVGVSPIVSVSPTCKLNHRSCVSDFKTESPLASRIL